jgi:hypothetical protein
MHFSADVLERPTEAASAVPLLAGKLVDVSLRKGSA